MNQPSQSPIFPQTPKRVGATAQVLIAVIVVTMLAGGGIWWAFGRGSGDDANAPMLTKVERGQYEHIVLEQGEIESSNNVEVRCQVKNRAGGNSPATTILDVIPEGSPVKEGDWLITFDSSALENELTQQTILCKTSETLVIQAKAAYDTAVMSRKEYLEGTYEQERKTIENELFVAEENLKKAELSYDSIKRSVSRGLISTLQLQGEQFRVDAARKELELATKKLDVLDNYTKEKMLTQLNSDIEAAKIKWENEQASHTEELKKLQEIKDQIAACTMVAPQSGQVVYANVMSRRSDSEFVVEPGASVRERQVLIRLPDPQNMQVSTDVNESQVNLVREGMDVSIRIDAIGDQMFRGVVTKVNKYAEPGSWWSSSAKSYKTYIRIVDPPPQIRSGLTAEVRIHIEMKDDALKLPVQAIMEHKGQTFCLVKQADGYETRPVTIASTNDKFIAIDESIEDAPKENEQVVLESPQLHGPVSISPASSLTNRTSDPNSQLARRYTWARWTRRRGARSRGGPSGWCGPGRQRPSGGVTSGYGANSDAPVKGRTTDARPSGFGATCYHRSTASEWRNRSWSGQASRPVYVRDLDKRPEAQGGFSQASAAERADLPRASDAGERSSQHESPRRRRGWRVSRIAERLEGPEAVAASCSCTAARRQMECSCYIRSAEKATHSMLWLRTFRLGTKSLDAPSRCGRC